MVLSRSIKEGLNGRIVRHRLLDVLYNSPGQIIGFNIFFSAFDMLLSRRLLEVLENAETDLKKLTRMSPSERQKYFDDGSGFYRHESYLNNVMFCKGTISDIQREEKGM